MVYLTLGRLISTSPLNTKDVLTFVVYFRKIVKIFNLIFGYTSSNISDDMVSNHPHVHLSINVIFIAMQSWSKYFIPKCCNIIAFDSTFFKNMLISFQWSIRGGNCHQVCISCVAHPNVLFIFTNIVKTIKNIKYNLFL